MPCSGTASPSSPRPAWTTEFGRIAALLHATTPERTPLQRELDRLGASSALIVIAIAIVVAFDDPGDAAGPHHGAVLVGVLLYTVSLAVSAVPEGLAAVTTVVLSLGMQRMAKRNAIVRRLAAVETLGSATVIASDKTGTLTQNEMTVRAVVTAIRVASPSPAPGYAAEGELHVDGEPLAEGPQRTEARRLLAAAHLASNAELAEREGRSTVLGDPTEGALKVAALKAGLTAERIRTPVSGAWASCRSPRSAS